VVDAVRAESAVFIDKVEETHNTMFLRTLLLVNSYDVGIAAICGYCTRLWFYNV
jgi:hypothetical protein